MPIKLSVFDMAGTTVSDTDHGVSNTLCSAFLKFGYVVPPEDILAVKGLEKKQAIKNILELHEDDADELTDDLIKKIHDVFVKEMIIHFSGYNGAKALPGVEDTFTKLHEMGIKVCLDTGFSKNIAETIIENLGWTERGLIDHYITADEVELGRPYPYMINKLMEMCGVADAKQVIKIGDTPADIKEGHNAGCLYSVGITTGAFGREQLQKCEPDYVIDNMLELIPIINNARSIPTLYEWACGMETFEKLTTLFYDKVLNDDLLEPIFRHMDANHPKHVAHFIAEVFKGPETYTGTDGGSHYKMIQKHFMKHLDEAKRQRWVALLLQAADEISLPNDPEFRSAFIAYIEWGTRIAVINSNIGEIPLHPEAPMPKWGWGETGGPYNPT